MLAVASNEAWAAEHIVDSRVAQGELRLVRDPSSTTSDEIALLVQKAKNGHRGAFDRLHARYAPMVHGLLLAHVPRQEVNDLVQDVFARAWLRLQDLKQDAAVGGWLAMMTRNIATDFHRRRRHDSSVDLIEIADPHAEHDAEAVRVLELIRSLPEAYRETLSLRLIEGLTGPEIAECTGLTHGSVRVNLHRGFQLLREKLGVQL
jgi:RNA polymerase sigma-70 factor (ECF subfamily)